MKETIIMTPDFIIGRLYECKDEEKKNYISNINYIRSEILKVRSDHHISSKDEDKKIKTLEERKTYYEEKFKRVESNINEMIFLLRNIEILNNEVIALEVAYEKVEASLNLIKSLYPEEEKDSVHFVFKKFREDKKEVLGKTRENLNKSVNNFKSFAEDHGKGLGKFISGYNKYMSIYEMSRSMQLEHRNEFFYSDKYEPIARGEAREKHEVLGKIEKDVREDKIQMEPTTVKLNFYTKKTYRPFSLVVDAKDKLEKMMQSEKRIDAINHARNVIYKANKDSQQSKFTNTLEALSELEEKEKKKLDKVKEEFDKLPFAELEKQEAKLEAERKKKEAINSYALTYQRYLEETDPNEKAKLLDACGEIARRTNLEEYDIDDAVRLAQERIYTKESEKAFERSERLRKKYEKEQIAIEQREEYNRLFDEVSREMVLSGWVPAGGTPMKYGGTDVDFVEDERLFYEEADRRVREKMGLLRKPIEKVDEPVEERQPLETFVESDVDVATAYDEIIEAFNYTPDGLLPNHANVSDRLGYYMSTLGMSAEERALSTLKKDGYVREDATVESIMSGPKYMRDALEAQIRIEDKVTKALAALKFTMMKRGLSRAEGILRAQKVSEEISQGGRHI